MKTPLIILSVLLLISCNTRDTPSQQQAQPQQSYPSPQSVPMPTAELQKPDTIILEVTEWQEAKVNNIATQKNMLDQQNELMLDAILDLNGKTRADVQGKAIVTKRKKK